MAGSESDIPARSRLEGTPPELVRTNPGMWALVVLMLVGLGAAALLIVRGVERGPRPPFLVQPPVSTHTTDFGKDPDVLHVAGSGSNLPITRALALELTTEDPSARIVVHESIGSTGGVRAVHDGAIDVGLVSRELNARERGLGFQVLPYAQVAVIFGVDPHLGVTDISSEQAIALYRGEQTTWPDGTPVVVLQREEGDSSHAVARQVIPGFAEADDAALDDGRWRVLYSDRAMIDALVSTRGAIGLIDYGATYAADVPIRALTLDGVSPSPAHVEDGTYPMTKTLSFVTPADSSERAREFLDFVFSRAGEQVIERHGYSSIPRDDP